jgi:hypothetical protein
MCGLTKIKRRQKDLDAAENYKRIRKSLPEYVTLVVAVKQRTPEEVAEIITAGATDIGENYVQEAEKVYGQIGEKSPVKWHMIGHLQRNKVNIALSIFDVIQTVDSLKLAEVINKRAEKIKKERIPVYIEVNSGREPQKSGVMPENAEELIRQILSFEHIKIEGLMTMGPRFGNPEDARPYFKETKKLFDYLRSKCIPNLDLKVLSMGMSNSYEIAVEEGSNMVRIGTAIFGERKY